MTLNIERELSGWRGVLSIRQERMAESEAELDRQLGRDEPNLLDLGPAELELREAEGYVRVLELAATLPAEVAARAIGFEPSDRGGVWIVLPAGRTIEVRPGARPNSWVSRLFHTSPDSDAGMGERKLLRTRILSSIALRDAMLEALEGAA